MRMAAKWWVATAIAAISLPVTGSDAQVRRVIRPGGSAAALLTTTAVQKELKLTPEQITKAKAMVERARNEFQEFLRIDLTSVDRHEVPDALEKKRSEMDAQQDSTLKTLLSAEQFKRVKQLDLQQAGIAGMLRTETAKSLNLTETQKDKLQAIEDLMQEEVQELFESQSAEETSQESNGGVTVRRRIDLKGEAATKLEKLREKATLKGVEMLSGDQKAKWKELTGEPFKFDPSGTSTPRPASPA